MVDTVIVVVVIKQLSSYLKIIITKPDRVLYCILLNSCYRLIYAKRVWVRVYRFFSSCVLSVIVVGAYIFTFGKGVERGNCKIHLESLATSDSKCKICTP